MAKGKGMFGKFSRIWSLTKSLKSDDTSTFVNEGEYNLPFMKNNSLRYGLFGVFAPPIAVYITFWLFTDFPYYLRDAPIHISHYWDLGSHGVANAVGIFFGTIIGSPLSLLIAMPYCARKFEKGDFRFWPYLLPAVIIGPVLAFVLFPLLFGWRDALEIAIPTIFASFLTMVLIYLGYVLAGPRITPEMLSHEKHKKSETNL